MTSNDAMMMPRRERHRHLQSGVMRNVCVCSDTVGCMVHVWTTVITSKLHFSGRRNSRARSDAVGRMMRFWFMFYSFLPSVEAWLSVNPKIQHLCQCSPSSSASQRRRVELTSLSAEILGIASAGILSEEIGSVRQAIVMACQDQEVTTRLDDMMTLETPVRTKILGATGRVMLLRASDVLEDEMFDLHCAISQEMDEMIYSNPPSLTQPILISIQSDIRDNLSEDDIIEQLAASIEHEVQQYEMNVPLPCQPTSLSDDQAYIPSLYVEVDGAQVMDPDGNSFWDTSTLLVFDNLVTDELRTKLLDVVLGREGDISLMWNDAESGPDPRRWARGGLLDIPAEEGLVQQSSREKEDGLCWGLRDDAISELCYEHHDALQEFETIITNLFSQFTVSRLPEAVLGAEVSPLTANAATCGDSFEWHIDADPNMTPPSPWTDIYGRYPNRCLEKPRFMSCLIYLSDDWEPADWGAPTTFLDVATDTRYDVQAKTGRVVIMDQDISHSVVAPLEAAGKLPRYSLVWKIILHPKQAGQDMTGLSGKRRSKWPEPLLLGSAAAEPKDETGNVR